MCLKRCVTSVVELGVQGARAFRRIETNSGGEIELASPNATRVNR